MFVVLQTEALVKLTEDGLAEVGGPLFRALNHFCSCMLTYSPKALLTLLLKSIKCLRT